MIAGQPTTAPLYDEIEAFNLVLTNAQEVVGVSRFGRTGTWTFFHVHRRTLTVEVYGVVDGIEGRAHNILIQHLVRRGRSPIWSGLGGRRVGIISRLARGARGFLPHLISSYGPGCYSG